VKLLSRDAVIRDLRARAARLRRPLQADDIHGRLWQSVMASFGSLALARRAAGLPDPPMGRPKTWTVPRIISELRHLYRTGVPINGPGLIGAGRNDLRVAAYQYAGGLDAARDLARIPRPVSRKWDRKRVLAAVRALHEEGPTRLASQALRKAAAAYFGSLTRARKAAGVPPLRRTWSRTAVIAALRETGGRVDSALESACRSCFGSVGEAKKAAGIRPRRRWTAAQVIAEIRAFEDVRLSSILDLEARRFFGTVAAARRAAGLAPLREVWTRDQALAAVAAADKSGRRLDPRACHACRRHFGSVEAARKALARRRRSRRKSKHG